MPPSTFTMTSAICCGRLATRVVVDSAGAAVAEASLAGALDRLQPMSTVHAARVETPSRELLNRQCGVGSLCSSVLIASSSG
jgi:hypothetical protein